MERRTISAVIIDDEAHAIQSMAGLLSLYCPLVDVVGQASSVQQGIKVIRRSRPDLVFLDIHIGEENGFQLLEQLQNTSFQLIFTTAHSDYAIKAFRYHAIDYLLKPVDPGQLVEAVEKVREKNASRLETGHLENLFQSLQTRQLKKITISSTKGFQFLEISEIVHVSGEGNYSTFHLKDGEKVIASKNLKYYHELLPRALFFRTHQSHLVNLAFVKMINTQEGYIIELIDGAAVPLARRHKDDLLVLMGHSGGPGKK